MKAKKCSKCKREQVLAEFYTIKSTGKPSSQCKTCVRAQYRAYNQTPARKAYNKKIQAKIKAAGYFKEYYQRPEIKARRAANMRRYAKDPRKRIKHMARWYLNHRIASGKVHREPCAICGKEQAEGHHLDYSKPLLIVWLCTKCHRKEHAKAGE